ncbi:MAG: transposase domain-containing protein [Methylococcales bacterium]
MEAWHTTKEFSRISGLSDKRASHILADAFLKDKKWNDFKLTVNKVKGVGYGGYTYIVNPASYPPDLFIKWHREEQSKKPVTQETKTKQAKATESSKALWERYGNATQHQKTIANERLPIVHTYFQLEEIGYKKGQALKEAAKIHGRSAATLRGWVRLLIDVDRQDWLATLCPNYKPGGKAAECDLEVWDFLVGHYLAIDHPDFTDSYERAKEIAENKAVPIPSAKTLKRRIEREFSPQAIVYFREGYKTLARMYPSQQRDKSCFKAGEAVSGDGLKLDKKWIKLSSGEISNTVTVWLWADIRTNKILAWRMGKTENTDLIRLSTYDLTEICSPTWVTNDNTTAAANKAMTGQHKGRHRFKNQPNDPIGLFLQMGMDVHFTNPDKETTVPGTNPIERSFGIGGLHSTFNSNPKIKGRGYSKATAILFEEAMEVFGDEVNRFNNRSGRRTPRCRGILSYSQAFEEDFKSTVVRKHTEEQRRLLLLMPETVRVNKQNGQISLKAGKGPNGKNRYWTEALSSYSGQDVVAYYDPENLSNPVYVYTLDTRYICEAKHMPGTAFNSTDEGREWSKLKQRTLKLQKKQAEEQKRMSNLELAAAYPDIPPEEIPEPGAIEGIFGGTGRVEIDGSGVPDDVESDEFLYKAMKNIYG